MRGPLRRLSIIALALTLVACQARQSAVAGATSTIAPSSSALATDLLKLEADRAAAIVAGDAQAVRPFLADDYWLVDSSGGVWSKQQYLHAIGSGQLDYTSWERASDVDVRVRGDTAILRYRARIGIATGQDVKTDDFWHTDYYERVDGQWEVVWSQVTAITN